MNFYNEIDPYACDWLENLIAAGHIPGGKVDRRSIRDIRAEEFADYCQAHFFTGIAGWPLAFRLAGWPATKPVWSGSCPCQSFSAAGEQAGLADPRNLWPPWFDQIRIRRPDTIFGEQVGNAVGFGWLDGISADLEREGYTVGACLLGAHSVGAPHIRQRLYWVAFTGQPRESRGAVSGLGNPDNEGPQGRVIGGDRARERLTGPAGVGFWERSDTLLCADGKRRRIEPGTFPLAHGVPARVGKLRAYGNAIVPQVAAEFIKAFMEIRNAPTA